jgi:hypothetical protein
MTFARIHPGTHPTGKETLRLIRAAAEHNAPMRFHETSR